MSDSALSQEIIEFFENFLGMLFDTIQEKKPPFNKLVAQGFIPQ